MANGHKQLSMTCGVKNSMPRKIGPIGRPNASEQASKNRPWLGLEYGSLDRA